MFKKIPSKWLIWTVLIGLVPTITRFIAWLLTKDGVVDSWLTYSDLVAFGLVLHVSNLNEVGHASALFKERWKHVQIGVSVFFVIVYGVIMGGSIAAGDNLDSTSVLRFTVVLSTVSFLLSYSVQRELEAREG